MYKVLKAARDFDANLDCASILPDRLSLLLAEALHYKPWRSIKPHLRKYRCLISIAVSILC